MRTLFFGAIFEMEEYISAFSQLLFLYELATGVCAFAFVEYDDYISVGSWHRALYIGT